MSTRKAENTKKNNEADVISFPGAQAQQEDTIDLKQLFLELLSRWWILVLAFVIGAAAYGAYTFMFITPQYEGSAMIYVYSKSTSITSLTDLQIGSQLTSDFTIIAKTREVIEQVIDDLSLNTTYEKLQKKITINNPDSSRVLEIVVTDPNPDRAADIANDMASVLSKRIAEVTNTDEPSIVQKAVSIDKKVSPSYAKNCLLGGLVLFLVAAIIIIAIYLLDDTIKTEEDVKKYLGLNTLAMIPVNHDALTLEEVRKMNKSGKDSGSSGSSRNSNSNKNSKSSKGSESGKSSKSAVKDTGSKKSSDSTKKATKIS